MGQVIGQSTRDGSQPLSEPLTNKHLLGTVMHTLLDVSEVRVTRGVPADVNQALSNAAPIPGLFS